MKNNYIKKACPVCNKEFSILHGKDGSSNKIYCSIKCSDEARRKRNKTIKGKMKSKRVTKKHIRNWKPIEPDGVPESDIWYRPAEPQKPSGKKPKIICNIAMLPKPYKYTARPVVTITEEKEERNLGGRPKSYTPAQDAVIIEMKKKGATFPQIGEQIGKSSEAVRRRWYRLAGIC